MLTILFIGICVALFAQDSSTIIKKLSYQGYVKNLQSLIFEKGVHEMISGDILHNRLNLKWTPSKSFEIVSEFRNRFLWGEQVRMMHDIDAYLRNDREWFNLQKRWVHQSNYTLHTNIERLYIDMQQARWQLRLGRQRINWGIGTIWNPNDLFNSFSFLDVDYEERPGADAAKLVYRISDFSDVSLAHSRSRLYGSITALRYFFNHQGYDIQLIAAKYLDRATVGLGWAGNIQESGWKGELQYFFRSDSTAPILNMSMELDHSFENGWYVNGGLLYNQLGVLHSMGIEHNLHFHVQPESLMPSRWNMLLGFQKEMDPLSSFTMNMVYAPGMGILIILPAYQYNLATNVDFSLFAQSYFAKNNGTLQWMQHIGMIRVRWSF